MKSVLLDKVLSRLITRVKYQRLEKIGAVEWRGRAELLAESRVMPLHGQAHFLQCQYLL